jgi:hypothetical protein
MMGHQDCNILVLFLGMILIIAIAYIFITDDGKDKITRERFGALQSLYSNDGIQDAYLTVENDPDNPTIYDPYAYWRGVAWDLPTRNLNRMVYYPYLYENYIDRYGRVYPYW